MRRLALTLPLILAACGSGGTVGNATGAFEKGFRDAFRSNFVEKCNAGAQRTSGSTRDFSVVCGCVADKLMAGKTATELAVEPSREENERLSRECLAEHPMM